MPVQQRNLCTRIVACPREVSCCVFQLQSLNLRLVESNAELAAAAGRRGEKELMALLRVKMNSTLIEYILLEFIFNAEKCVD